MGEAYDKVAKMMGMGFPGGAKIAALASSFRRAQHPDIHMYRMLFPRSFLDKHSLDFSFSGLKSAVKRYIDGEGDALDDRKKSAIAYAFEEAVLDVLIEKILLAAEREDAPAIVLA